MREFADGSGYYLTKYQEVLDLTLPFMGALRNCEFTACLYLGHPTAWCKIHERPLGQCVEEFK